MPERVEPVLRMLHVAAKARATGLATTENGVARLLAACGDESLLAETLSTLGDDALSRTGDLEPALLHIEKSDGEPSSSWAVALPGEAKEMQLFLVACSVNGETGGHQLRETLRDGARLAALALGGNSIDAPTDAGRGSDDLAEPMPRDVAIRIIEHARTAAPTKARSALMLLDLDRFRAINDALGMGAGDALLSMTAARLQAILKPEERLVRLEGDRFVIVLRRARTQLQPFAQAALKAIGSPVRLGGKSVSIQACIGVVANPPVEVPTSIVLLQADTALKRAKQVGRNHVVVHEPEFDAAILEKSQLELELSDAPANGQMRLVYQPYMDLASRSISGCEALLRWRHPTRGEIHPDTFIPIAEATSLILPLGAWALRRACADAMTWPPHLILSVNISALQFQQSSFKAQVDAALSESGFPPERLELEITESVLMRDNSETIAQIQSLVDQGVRFALDDFGTGYSALAYLARLPHHRIKLDKSFVKDLNNPATSELIRAIISSARSTGVAVTAEGVERPEQLDQLSDIGFTHAQGFAVGAPKEKQAVTASPVEAEIA